MKYKQKRNSKKSKKSLLIALVAVLVLLAGSYYVYSSDLLNLRSSDNPAGQDSVNFDPPTEEEQEAGNEVKEKLTSDKGQSENKNHQTPASNDQAKKSVTVVVVDAGQYDDVIEVRAYTPDVLQEGVCTITFTRGSHTVVKEVKAHPDVSSTICTNLEVKRNEFPAGGEWSVVIDYTSQTAQGKSKTSKINIR